MHSACVSIGKIVSELGTTRGCSLMNKAKTAYSAGVE